MEGVISVPMDSFERLMTTCCNQHDCLDKPSECLCAQESGINLKDILDNIS